MFNNRVGGGVKAKGAVSERAPNRRNFGRDEYCFSQREREDFHLTAHASLAPGSMKEVAEMAKQLIEELNPIMNY